MLSYGRHDLTAKVLAHNLTNHGLPPGDVGLFVADTFGIAKATNQLLLRAYSEGYDYFCICGNDILEPANWLQLRKQFIEWRPNTGMVSIKIGHAIDVASAEMVIANFMISRATLETVGRMDERFDPYGAIDLDYNKRCNRFGLTNYYIPSPEPAQHIHDHDGVELYGFKKIDKVNETWALHRDGDVGNIPLILQDQFGYETTANQ